MSKTDIFNSTLQKTNLILKQIEKEFNWDDRHKAYTALRAVLHTLRDRLNVNQAAAFASQLTIVEKGIFYDGWDPAQVPIKMHREVFLENIRQKFLPFPVEYDLEIFANTILRIIRASIDPFEMEKIRSILPDDLKKIFV